MDNLKYYNESLAYDFDRFMPRTEVRKENKENNIVKLPRVAAKQRTRKRAAVKTVSVSAFAVMASIFVLAALCGNIFLRLQINEVNSQINNLKTEINALDSQKVALEVELERKISYSNIELEAAEMGMQKMDKNQVTYIRVNDKNTATVADGKTVSESVN